MKNSKILIYFLLFCFVNLSLQAKTVIDMSNTKVEIPDKIEKAFGSAPPTTYLISLFNPNILVGHNFPAYNMNNFTSKEYVGEYFMNLPILGGWQGNQKGANIEKLLSLNTQVIFSWQNDFLLKKVEKSLRNINIPILMIDADNLEKMPETFKFLGEGLNDEKRGEELSSYAKDSLLYITSITENIKDKEQKSFYYAEGNEGLQSDCTYSFHTTPFRFVKAKNIYECDQKDTMGMESMNFETILKANPDFIIIQSPKFYKKIFSDEKWKLLKAVKNRNVYLAPRIPFNWIDRPPSFMRLLAIHWLTKIFYPNRYTKDINEEIKKFYKIFFHKELNKQELKDITKGAF
ncbi:ABC transporter substrate-binding protein [Halarcobacter ebronensis]|nr:ABC transporter substrate-binding protein [Halarcobacter ebronensis]